MSGLFLILLFYLLGLLVSELIGGFVPGSVIGMVLLFAALSLKWVRPGHVRRTAVFITRNMMLFFVPVGVGLMASYSLIAKDLWAILVASLASTLLVIAVVGRIVQKTEKK